MLTFFEKAVDCSPSEKTSLARLVIYIYILKQLLAYFNFYFFILRRAVS